MSLFNIKETDPKTDPDTIAMYAHALDAWTETLADASVEFTLMGLKMFENINGFYPPTATACDQFLLDLNDFVLSWPSNEELEEADHTDKLRAVAEAVLKATEAPRGI